MLTTPSQKTIDNEKVEQIIRSCQTLEQLEVAAQCSRLFGLKYGACADRLCQIAIIHLYDGQIRAKNREINLFKYQYPRVPTIR